MLSVASMGKAGEGASDYYTHLAVEDYYQKGGEPPGQWYANALTEACFTGIVKDSHLRSVLEGFEPMTGQVGAQNAGPEHMAGCDLTFSAPKSVSVLWAMSDETRRQQIQDIQNAAVDNTLAFIEAHVAKTRRGKAGREAETVKNLIVSKFEHSTSRAQDPQLHTHCLIANLALRHDGSWGSLEGKPFFQWKMALGAYYRAELSNRLQRQMGLRVQRDGSSFRVIDVPRPIDRAFSQRRLKIEEELEARSWSTAKGAQMISENSRDWKPYINRPELFKQWQEKGSQLGFGPDQVAAFIAPPCHYPTGTALFNALQGSTIGERMLRHSTDLSSLETLLRYHGVTNLVCANAKESAILLDAGEHFIRIGEGEYTPRPDSPMVVSANRHGKVGNTWYEFLPKQPLLGNVSAEQKQRFQDQLKAHGFVIEQPDMALFALHNDQLKLVNSEQLSRRISIVDPQDALLELTDKRSVFAEQDVFRLVAERSQCIQGAESIKEDAQAILRHRDVVVLTKTSDRGESIQFSTTQMVALEKNMVINAVGRKHDSSHHLPEKAVKKAIAAIQHSKGFSLNPEQKHAVEHIGFGSGGVVCIRGDSGAGKSTAMEAVNKAFGGAGYQVVGTALAGKASRKLQESSGIQSQTLHSLLTDLDKGERAFNRKTVVVVDEAGMVGSRQMARLLDRAQAASAKVVLVGDEKQLQPISAGGAFKAIAKKLGAIPITENMRQVAPWARDAVSHFANGDAAKALGLYHAQGRLVLTDTPQSAKARLVNGWLATRQARPKSSVLMIANTRQQVSDLNSFARYRLKEEGLLQDGVHLQTHCGPLEVSVGDRLLLTRNSRLLGVENGNLATVQSLHLPSDERYWSLTLTLDDGRLRTLNLKDYNYLEHGYAATTHKSQGDTLSETFVLIGEDSMVSREIALVQNSRHKDDSHVYIDRDSVQELLAGLRPTEAMINYAEALAEKNTVSLPPGYESSFEVTRAFLDEYSRKQLGFEEVAPELKELEGLFLALNKSYQKETTMDYQRDGRSYDDTQYQYEPPIDPALFRDFDASGNRLPQTKVLVNPLTSIFFSAEQMANAQGDTLPGNLKNDARAAIEYLRENNGIHRDELIDKAVDCLTLGGQWVGNGDFKKADEMFYASKVIAQQVGEMDQATMIKHGLQSFKPVFEDATLQAGWQQGADALNVKQQYDASLVKRRASEPQQ